MIIPFTADDVLVEKYTQQMKERAMIQFNIDLRSYCDTRLKEIRKKLKETKPSRYRAKETWHLHQLMIYYIQQRANVNCMIQDYRDEYTDDFLAYKESIKDFIEKNNLPYTVHQLLRTNSIKKHVKPEHHRHFSVFVEQMRDVVNVNKCVIA